MQTYLLEVSPGEGALQAAFDALPASEEIPVVIRLLPGVYREKVQLRRGNVTVEGTGKPEDTVISWDDGAFEMLPDGMKRGTFRTATLFVDGAGITLRALTVENTAAPREQVGQALALYVDGDRFLCEDCILRSHQDTLFTAPLPPKEIQKNGFIGPKQYAPRIPQRHTYRRCRISGDVDFIFGGAAAWFEQCEIIADDGRADRTNLAEGACCGYCTAASTPEGQRFGYVFRDCRFTTVNCPEKSVYLGRPWREWAKTVLIGCELGAHIKPEGFDDWGKPLFHEVGDYAEYGSTGAGAAGVRADFARAMTAEEAEGITYEAFMASL